MLIFYGIIRTQAADNRQGHVRTIVLALGGLVGIAVIALEVFAHVFLFATSLFGSALIIYAIGESLMASKGKPLLRPGVSIICVIVLIVLAVTTLLGNAPTRRRSSDTTTRPELSDTPSQLR